MPPSFCLLPKHADAFLKKVESGELDPAAFAAMTSAERHAAFAEIVGEANATHVNATFESKLLLKNQQQGLKSWIDQVTGLKPEIKRDLVTRVERMDRVLEPKAMDAFLADLAKQRLGFGVTMEEAGRISELAKAVSDSRTALEGGGDRLAYGRARVEFANYVSELKNGTKKPITASGFLSNVAGFSKSIKASFDNSALLRQGWKNLFAHPEIWYQNAKQSFVDLVQQFGGKEVMNEVNADILSRPNAMNGRYAKAKLALANVEDQFPSSLPEKIPVLGRAYKASEAAFTAFQYRMRADVFDKYMEIAEKSGVDLADPRQLESIGRLVNSLTARGHLGPAEPAANVTNAVFFSARKLKSDFDFLTAHQLEGGVTPFVRKQAAINLVKVTAGTAAILAIARAVDPKSVELDPRSSDFGKIRVKDTRFDVTGGMGSLITLAARLLTMSSKSSTTGKVTPLNSGGFGARSGTDVVYNFFENKLSPAAALVKDLLKGHDFEGNPITVQGELSNLFTPLPITNIHELATNPNAANVVLATIADALGISVNTYSPKPKKASAKKSSDGSR
jgi:hypothetical protein